MCILSITGPREKVAVPQQTEWPYPVQSRTRYSSVGEFNQGWRAREGGDPGAKTFAIAQCVTPSPFPRGSCNGEIEGSPVRGEHN